LPSLNPQITVDEKGVAWLDFTPDPTAEGYKGTGATGKPWHTWDKAHTHVKLGDAEDLPAEYECQVSALDVRAPETAYWPTPPPSPEPEPVGDFPFPGSMHIWGGNENQMFTQRDVVVANHRPGFNPGEAKKSNPSLVAMSALALDALCQPWSTSAYKGFSWTYGGGLLNYGGLTDSLAPNPQGPIPNMDPSKYAKKTDGSWAANGYPTNPSGPTCHDLGNTQTVDILAKLGFWNWKQYGLRTLGYSGEWTDNDFPGAVIQAGWASPGINRSNDQWEAGWVALAKKVRAFAPGMWLGGNVAYRSTSADGRGSRNLALREEINSILEDPNASSRANRYADDLAQVNAWYKQADLDGYPKILLVSDKVPDRNAQRMAFGLACATLMRGYYCAFDGNHTNTYLPAEMMRNGQKHYLGLADGEPTRSGNVFTGRFKDAEGASHTVTANFDSKTGTFG